MARPTWDEIETYMSITGASESQALQKLEEYGGNLNEAVNAHFSGADIPVAHPPPAPIPQHNFVATNNESQFGRGLFPMLSAARSFKPSLLLDPNYRRDLFNRIGAAGFAGRASSDSPPPTVMGLPVQPNSRHERPYHSAGDDYVSTEYNASHLDNNNVEDAMIQAAIMASKREAEASSGSGLSERRLQEEDDFARAASLSLKTAEQEKAVREQQVKDHNQEVGTYRRSKPASASNINGVQNVREQQQLRQKSILSTHNRSPRSEDAFHFEEWGGMSSKEIDEALMLETALFGEISEGAPPNCSLNATQAQSGPEKVMIPDLQPICRPSSLTLPESRLLKEQQDAEYLASLLLDKEKEEESHRKMLNEVESKRRLAAKKASLPCEPVSDDENAVTLLVRMPNGNRLGRRFLKSDKLQLLFDFIDINGAIKSGTYRVVRSYPRRAYKVDDSLLTFSELGLTNKQEALFLELL